VHGGFGWSNQLANVAPMAIAALASAPSIIGGGFDLSISPLICLTNCVFVVWLIPHGLGGAVSVPIVLAIGLGVGVLNGVLIVLLRVQPIVVTLAMFFGLQGVDDGRNDVVLRAVHDDRVQIHHVEPLGALVLPPPGDLHGAATVHLLGLRVAFPEPRDTALPDVDGGNDDHQAPTYLA